MCGVLDEPCWADAEHSASDGVEDYEEEEEEDWEDGEEVEYV